MGPVPPTVLDHLRLLADAAGRAPAAPDAPLWSDLFSPPVPFSSLPAAALEEACGGYFEALAAHAPTTRNFESLLRAAAAAITTGVTSTGPHPAAVAASRRGADAAALTRALLKLAAERVEPARLTTLVSAAGGADALAAAVVGGLGAPAARAWPPPALSPSVYLLRLELAHLALVLASGPLYTPAGAPGRHPLTDALLRQRGPTAACAVAGLLTTVAAAPAPPAGTPLPRDDGDGASTTTVAPPSRVARIVRVALTAARRAAAALLGRPPPPPPGSRGPLADAACAALLVLLHTAPSAGGAGSPFVAALAATVDAGAVVAGAPSVPFAALTAALATGHGTDADALLTYALLRGCPAYADAVLARAPDDAVRVALPLLHALYDASPRAPAVPPPPPARTYMLLVNCLMLTQEPSFCDAAAAPLPRGAASFYRDGALGPSPSTAALATAVLLRAAHGALGRGRDVYQLTTALAAAANLAPAAAPLPAHAAARAVRLLERLAARHARLAADGGAPDEARVYEDLTRVALELVNAALAAALARAPPPAAAADVVYALLHRGDALAPLASHPRFADLASNIDAVVSFFGGRVEAAARGAAGGDAADALPDVTAAAALAAVRAALPDWPRGGLAPLPDLRFSYEEEPDAASFFGPAAWAAALRATRARVAWTPAAVALFPASDDTGGGVPAGGLDLADAAALASTASLDSVCGGESVV